MAQSSATTGEGGATPPKPKRRPMVTIYNKSKYGQKATIPGGKLPPGQSARVPLEYGNQLIERVPYIVRAERGDPMGE